MAVNLSSILKSAKNAPLLCKKGDFLGQKIIFINRAKGIPLGELGLIEIALEFKTTKT